MKEITKPVVNGDQNIQPGAGGAGASQASAAGAPKKKHEPAFQPPQGEPAVPVDEHHGKGGMYVIVDGKRVPADEDGKPLPPAKK